MAPQKKHKNKLQSNTSSRVKIISQKQSSKPFSEKKPITSKALFQNIYYIFTLLAAFVALILFLKPYLTHKTSLTFITKEGANRRGGADSSVIGVNFANDGTDTVYNVVISYYIINRLYNDFYIMSQKTDTLTHDFTIAPNDPSSFAIRSRRPQEYPNWLFCKISYSNSKHSFNKTNTSLYYIPDANFNAPLPQADTKDYNKIKNFLTNKNIW